VPVPPGTRKLPAASSTPGATDRTLRFRLGVRGLGLRRSVSRGRVRGPSLFRPRGRARDFSRERASDRCPCRLVDHSLAAL